jgi:large subunit ribosomal protein L20
LKLAEIDIDRKILADIAVHDPDAFGVLAQQAKASLGASS